MPDMATDGRVALVTGAAQGLGLAAARQLLAMGFRGILMLDRNGELLRHAASGLGQGKTLALQGDLMDSDLPCRAVEACLQRFGRLDVLINAAGNTERCGLDDTTHDSFESLFGVNARAPFFLMQEAVKPMRTQGSGVIINVSSMLAHGGPPN